MIFSCSLRGLYASCHKEFWRSKKVFGMWINLPLSPLLNMHHLHSSISTKISLALLCKIIPISWHWLLIIAEHCIQWITYILRDHLHIGDVVSTIKDLVWSFRMSISWLLFLWQNSPTHRLVFIEEAPVLLLKNVWISPRCDCTKSSFPATCIVFLVRYMLKISIYE